MKHLESKDSRRRPHQCTGASPWRDRLSKTTGHPRWAEEESQKQLTIASTVQPRRVLNALGLTGNAAIENPEGTVQSMLYFNPLQSPHIAWQIRENVVKEQQQTEEYAVTERSTIPKQDRGSGRHVMVPMIVVITLRRRLISRVEPSPIREAINVTGDGDGGVDTPSAFLLI